MTDLDPRWSDAIRRAGRVPVDLDAAWSGAQARAASGPVLHLDARRRIPPRRQALVAAAAVVLLACAIGGLALRGPRTSHTVGTDRPATTTALGDGPSLADVVVPDPVLDWTIGIGADPTGSNGPGEACVEVGFGSSGPDGGRTCGPIASAPATSGCTASSPQLRDAYGDGSCIWTALVPRGAVALARVRRPGQAVGPVGQLAAVPGVRVTDLLADDRPLTAISLVLRGSGAADGMDRHGLEVSLGRPTVGPTVAEVVVADVPVDWTVAVAPDGLDGAEQDDDPPGRFGEGCIVVEQPEDEGRFCTTADVLARTSGEGPTWFTFARTPSGGVRPGDRMSVIRTVVVPAGLVVLARAAFEPGDPLGAPMALASVPGVRATPLDLGGQAFTALSMVLPGAGPDEDGEPQVAVLEVTWVG